MIDINTISVKELDDYHGNDDVIIIDLRSLEEYQKSHFDGAVNIPYEELEECRKLSRKKTLILYCERGSASLFASRELMKMGFRVKSVVGGFRAYNGSNLYFPGRHSKIR